MKTILSVFIFLCFQFSTPLLAQNLFQIKGNLINCDDSKTYILGFVSLIQGDSTVQTIYLQNDGNYTFTNLKSGTYQLFVEYYYMKYFSNKITLNKDTTFNICLKNENVDSLLSKYKLKDSYTIYYYGAPIYQDENLNEIGLKYGVVWENLGCRATDKYDKYNSTIKEILNYKNGKDWEYKFWKEVKFKYSTNY